MLGQPLEMHGIRTKRGIYMIFLSIFQMLPSGGVTSQLFNASWLLHGLEVQEAPASLNPDDHTLASSVGHRLAIRIRLTAWALSSVSSSRHSQGSNLSSSSLTLCDPAILIILALVSVSACEWDSS